MSGEGDFLADLAAMQRSVGRGRPTKVVPMQVLRELTEEDLRALEGTPAESSPPVLKKLRQTHHQLARVLAGGASEGEASALTGYSPSRISILKADPAFAELLHFYSGEVQREFLDAQARLAAFGMSALDELQERLEEDPSGFSNKELLGVVEMTMDRTLAPKKGQGPQGQGTSAAPVVNINFVRPQGMQIEGTAQATIESDWGEVG